MSRARLPTLVALEALAIEDATLVKCYYALADATIVSPGVTFADLINAWESCTQSIEDTYSRAVMQACTYLLLSECLGKVGASEAEIKNVRDLAKTTWANA